MVKKHPEKRRVPILCGLCEVNETLVGCGVCFECHQLYRLGKDTKKSLATGEKITHSVQAGVLSYRVDPNDYKSAGASLAEVVGLLLEQAVEDRYAHRGEVHLRTDNYRVSSSGYAHKFHMTEGQGEAIQRFIDATYAQIDYEYKRGYREGSSIFHRLTKGSATIEQADRMAKNREE